MRRSLAGCALLAWIVLAGCASPGPKDPLPVALDEALQELVRRHHVCAATLAVVRNRKLKSVHAATGCNHAAAPGQASVFQAASLSKPVFAYAVLKLVAEGKMGLDVPVLQYLPQGYRHQFDPLKAAPAELVTDPRMRSVTVRMLLNHTSGLPNWAGGPLRFEAPPGAGWHYSGEGYLLLQRAVEEVTRMPLERFMAAQVFAPLAMRDSDYVASDRLAARLVAGTKANGAPRTTLELARPVAAFSLHTTAADYGAFLAALLNDGRALTLLSDAPVQVDHALGVRWGLGWGIAGDPADPTIWQWGSNSGYRAFAMAAPRSGDGFVLLTNSENGLRLAEPLARRILPGDHKLFRFSALDDDILTQACMMLHLCL